MACGSVIFYLEVQPGKLVLCSDTTLEHEVSKKLPHSEHKAEYSDLAPWSIYQSYYNYIPTGVYILQNTLASGGEGVGNGAGGKMKNKQVT